MAVAVQWYEFRPTWSIDAAFSYPAHRATSPQPFRLRRFGSFPVCIPPWMGVRLIENTESRETWMRKLFGSQEFLHARPSNAKGYTLWNEPSVDTMI